MDNIGINIRTARKEKGITMKELGALIGASESAVSLYERGKREPSYETLLMIAEELGTSVSSLMGEETKKAPSEDGEIDELLEELRREEVRTLLEATRGMSRGEVEAMADFAKKLKGGN